MLGRVSKRVGSFLPGSKSRQASNDAILSDDPNLADDDSPEGTTIRNVRLFCETSSTTDDPQHEESLNYVHLPAISEATESSPAAAAAAAKQISKYLQSSKKPHVLYNAIMLTHLLSDHPGSSFTQNFDDDFIKAVKHVLKSTNSQGTKQYLNETLRQLEMNKLQQPGVKPLIDMWKECGGGRDANGFRAPSAPQNGYNAGRVWQGPSYIPEPTMSGPYGQRAGGQDRPIRSLPPPVELASRIEEARNTAKILIQFLSTTPAEEFLKNEFIHEFKDRCEAAQKSMSAYINCENPAPDVETLMTLIETNETLSIAMSRYQRCRLAAIQTTGGASRTPDLESRAGRNGSWNGVQNNASNYGTQQAQNSTTAFASPPVLPPVQAQSNSLFAPRPQSAEANAFANGNDARQTSIVHDFASNPSQPPPSENPFADPRNMTSTPEPPTEGQRYSAPKSYVPVAPPSQTFNIDSEPSYPANQPATYQYSPKRNTSELEANNYTGSGQRPAYSTAGATPSYMGRQASAANGLTMHGAGGPLQNEVPEIDGSSGMGRTDSGRTAADSAHGVTPAEVRRR